MGLYELVYRNRCYRRYESGASIDKEVLKSFVDLARLSSSAQNLQPLKYCLSCDRQMNGKIFDTLSWAGYLQEWEGPSAEERPEAYIVVLGDRSIGENFAIDAGIAAQSIRLGAMEKGFGSCIIASCDRGALSKILKIPESLEVLFVISFGIPGEEIVLEEMTDKSDIKYYRDSKDLHHLPKRTLEDIILH